MITKYKRQQKIMYWGFGLIGVGVALFIIIFAPRLIRVLIPVTIVISIITGVLIVLNSMSTAFASGSSLTKKDENDNVQ